MQKKTLTLIALSICGLLASFSASATSILVAHPITVGIAESLLKDTDVEILPATPTSLPASRQLNYLENRGKDELVELSQKADGVITAKSIFAQDYLYPLARRSNIKIIPIDIATPIDGAQSGVAKLALDIDEHPVWLNPNGLSAMLMIFSDESTRLDPKIKEQVAQNLDAALNRLRKVTNDMEFALDSSEVDPVILVTDPALDYFVQGLQMQSYHIDDTTAASPEALATFLAQKGINIVITGSKLSDEQQQVLDEQGIQSLRISRLKAEDPIDQLAAYYDELTQILQTLN